MLSQMRKDKGDKPKIRGPTNLISSAMPNPIVPVIHWLYISPRCLTYFITQGTSWMPRNVTCSMQKVTVVLQALTATRILGFGLHLVRQFNCRTTFFLERRCHVASTFV